MRLSTQLGALGAVMGLLLVGCSGGASSDSSSSVAVAPSVGKSASDSEIGGTAVDQAAPVAGVDIQSQVVRTADITVRTADVTRDAGRAAQLAVTAGGEVQSDNRQGAGKDRTADLVLRVLPARLSDVLSALAALGDELSRSVTAEDVSTVVADVNSRVASMQASITRLQALSAQATDISDLVTLETELGRREADLESLQAQQRALSDQVAMATVSVHLMAEHRPDNTDKAGFLAGLAAGWDAFLTAGRGLLTAIGAALPFLVLIAVLGGIVLLVLRRRRPALARPPAGAAQSE